MCWDVTVICPLAESYVNGAAIEEGAAAEVAASREEVKYAEIDSRYVFEPIAVKTLAVFNSCACLLLNEVGKRISANSSEARETNVLFQCFSVLVQRFNAILLHDTLLPLSARTELS